MQNSLVFRSFIFLLGLAACVELGAATATWSAELGFGGVAAPGNWVPLRLTVDPSLGPWTLELRWKSTNADSVETFSEQSGGQLEFPVFLPDGTDSLRLSLSSGGIPGQDIELSVVGKTFPGNLVLVDGLSPDDHLAVGRVLEPYEPVRVVDLSPARWPTSPWSFGPVAALAARDPGPILSPAQATALRAWLSAGGRLAVLEPRVGKASVLWQVWNGPPPGRAEFGLGRVVAVPAGPVAWKDALQLTPYEKSRRLGPDFASAAAPRESARAITADAPTVFLAVWTLVVVLLVFRKKGTRSSLAVGAVLATLAVTVLWWGGWMRWDRGAVTRQNLVVLPEGVGGLMSFDVSVAPQTLTPTDLPKSSPWGVAVSLRPGDTPAPDTGKLVPLGPSVWNHAPDSPAAWVRRADRERLILNAFVSPESISVPSLVASPSRVRVQFVDASAQWMVRDGTGWKHVEETPASLGADAEWVLRLAAQNPGLVWSAGMDDLPALSGLVEGRAPSQVCWAFPEMPGGLP